ncbi:hypothetical protein [Paludisphaera rhizosphaerae]|uniref:hypothetical protein n=1 Tax=Paludisphaera rhizosphaerae TaxID=2711216 RepID=UPI0013EA329E|nr:hypothetical protein [Paludisphaera rhizosphaerae]
MISTMLAAFAVLMFAPPPVQEPKTGVAPVQVPTTAADRVTLRDGKVILGLVTSQAAGPRVGFDMLVRRDWAEAHVPDLAAKWVRNAGTMRKPAVAERRRRLEAWRDERSRFVGGGDKVLVWIDAELKRLEDPKALDAPLLSIHIARDGCRTAERNSDASRRMLALAWLSNLPNPEDATPGELTDSVEARGFMVEGTEVPSLDRLLPIVTEPEAKWLARRAATELTVDSGRRFIRYNNVLLPEQTDGQALNAPLDLNSALGQLAGLLDPSAAATDPLAPALAKISAQGGRGAVVTRMDMAPDLSQVRVDIALWVRGPQGWVEFGSRNAVARPDDAAPAATAVLENDPQIQSVFNFADALGLGTVTAEMKQRGLRMGAATSKALGQARSAFSQDLSGLAFPVLEAAPAPAAGPANPPGAG